MISIRIKYTSTLNTNGYNYYEGIITSFQAGLSEMNASFLSNNYLKYIEKSMSYSSEFPGTVPAFRGDFTDQLYGNTPFGLSSSILYIFCFNDKFFYSKYNFSLLIFETNQVSLSGNEKFLSIRQDINNWNGEDYIITCAIIEDISMLTYKLTVIVTKISDNTKTQQSFTNPIGTYIYVNSCKSIGQWIFICTEGTFNNNYNYCYSIYLNDPNPSSISNNTSTVLFSKIDVGNSSKKIWYVLDFFFIENIKYFEVSMYLNMYRKF